MNTIAIINTKASRATLRKAEYETLFETAGVQLRRLTLLDKPEELPQVLRESLKTNPECVVIGGGDGTIMSFADIAKQTDYQGKLAILPVGTANYLARNLDIPLDLKEAVKVISQGKPVTVNLPRANKVLFSLLLSIGVVSAASSSVSVRFKRKAGQLAYVIETLNQLRKHRSFNYKIKSKSGRKLEGRSHQIMLINADVSQQFEVIPDSKLSQPSMTLTVYETNASKFRLILAVVAYVLSIGHIRMGLRVIKDTGFTIETDPKEEVSVDGEVSLETPLEISAGYRRITILCP